jgi:hypothetical protein
MSQNAFGYNPELEEDSLKKEVDDFLDQVLVERPKAKPSIHISTPPKGPRPSSPLPASVPRAPKAMLAFAAAQTPTKATTGSNKLAEAAIPLKDETNPNTLFEQRR